MGDHVLMEKVSTRFGVSAGCWVGRWDPLDRIAALGVSVQSGRNVAVGDALRVGVVDCQNGSRLRRHCTYSPFDVRRDIIADLVDPVIQLDAGKSHGRHGDRGARHAGVLDQLQPQAGRGAIAGIRERVLQTPPVDVPVVRVRPAACTVVNLRCDMRKQLASEKCRCRLIRARLFSSTYLVKRDVWPGVSVGCSQRLTILSALDRDTPFVDVELHPRCRRLSGGKDGIRALTVVNALQISATSVRTPVACGPILGVVVRLLGVPVRSNVAMRVNHIVQVPAPCLIERSRCEIAATLVARFSDIVTENRNGKRRTCLRLAGFPPGETVPTEVVLSSVARGNDPVFTIVVTVFRADLELDPFAVVVLHVPAIADLDERTRLAVQNDRRIVLLPAQIKLAFLPIVCAGAVRPLDVGGGQVETLSYP
ncbi:hypothetical protein RKD47_005781 [Streptomyces albogriseolus]